MKKIWIDLDNSPHVPFFAPIIQERESQGYTVCVTARDCFQVRPLADLLQLFQSVLDFRGTKPRTKVIVLPRNDRQEVDVRSKWSSLFATGQVVIPDKVVDGLNIIWHSDLMISGGGTMNHEAAALGVPGGHS